MEIKVHRLELFNFKSYRGHVSIGPFSDFSCIVGHNGAGKSNIMDAFGFILGYSAKSLRGESVTDLIYRQVPPLEFSSATIYFRDSHDTETSITRTIELSGHTTQFVNRISVTSEEFIAHLRKLGLHSHIKTFLVFQQEVESMAQKHEGNLKDLIEEISGSGQLLEEYNSACNALNKTQHEATLIMHERRQSLLAVNQLNHHEKNTEEYRGLRTQIKCETLELAMMELLHIETFLRRQIKQQRQLTDEFEEIDNRIKKKTVEFHNNKRLLTEKKENYASVAQKFRESGIAAREKKSNLERLKSSCQHLSRIHTVRTANLKNYRQRFSVRTTQLQQLELQLLQLKDQLKAFEEKCQTEDADHVSRASLTENQWVEYHELRKKVQDETISLNRELEQLRRERNSLLDAIKQVDTTQEHHNMTKRELTDVMESAKLRLSELSTKRSDLMEELNGFLKVLKELEETQESQKHSEKTHEHELYRINEQLHELHFCKEDDMQQDRHANALQCLRGLYPDIIGRMVDLVDISNTRYRLAITAALGKYLDAIIVRSTETAIACVKYLKEQRLLSMTFLPLDRISSMAMPDSSKTYSKAFQPIINFITYDPEIANAVQYVIGDVFLSHQIDEAKQMAYHHPDGKRRKVVTLDGTVLLKNGTILGGLASIESRVKKWDEKKYDSLFQQRKVLLEEIHKYSELTTTRLQCEIQEVKSRIEHTQRRLRVLEAEETIITDKLHNLGKEIIRHEKVLRQTQEQVDRYKERLKVYEADMLLKQKTMATILSRTFTSFQLSNNIDYSWIEWEINSERLQRTRTEHRQQLILAIQKLTNGVDEEIKASGLKSLQDAESELAKISQELSSCQKDFETYRGIVDHVEKQHLSIQFDLTSAKEKVEENERILRHDLLWLEKSKQESSSMSQHLNMINAGCEALKHQRLILLRKFLMDGIDLHLNVNSTLESDLLLQNKNLRDELIINSTSPSLDTFSQSEPFLLPTELNGLLSESVVSSVGISREAISEGTVPPSHAFPQTDEWLLQIDFSKLPQELHQVASEKLTFSTYKQAKKTAIQKMEMEAEKLSPHLKLSSSILAAKERLETSTLNLQKTHEKVRASHQRFQAVKERRKELFLGVFNRVASMVEKIYQELTSEGGSSNHIDSYEGIQGTAYLTLERTDEPYNGGVIYQPNPPLKRLMSLDALSGGERTMAALALLFAIHSVTKNPFFILDEVDASLDLINVERLSRYLRQQSKESQIIAISLRPELYAIADRLLGIYKDHDQQSSVCVTLDLSNF